MSAKKQTNVRTGKMVRELMLADKEVTASLIMVYSKNGVNEEIKIEGLHPKSNEELFLSGKVDWNKSVIYKIVDFTGKAEVGKALLTDMKKNNITLEIERVMWSKETQEEAAAEEELTPSKAESKPAVIHKTPAPEKDVTPKPQPIASAPIRMETKAQEIKAQEIKAPIVPEVKAEVVSASIKPDVKPPVPQPVIRTAEEPAVPVVRPVKHTEVEKPFAQEQPSELAARYDRLVSKAKEVCQDYDLGVDMDDSIEALKEELQKQGVSLDFDAEIMDAVRSLRELKTKGINIDKILNLL